MNDFLAKPFKAVELQEKIVAAAARGKVPAKA
jgi:FixJ family two-component response regulator